MKKLLLVFLCLTVIMGCNVTPVGEILQVDKTLIGITENEFNAVYPYINLIVEMSENGMVYVDADKSDIRGLENAMFSRGQVCTRVQLWCRTSTQSLPDGSIYTIKECAYGYRCERSIVMAPISVIEPYLDSVTVIGVEDDAMIIDAPQEVIAEMFTVSRYSTDCGWSNDCWTQKYVTSYNPYTVVYVTQCVKKWSCN